MVYGEIFSQFPVHALLWYYTITTSEATIAFDFYIIIALVAVIAFDSDTI